MNAIIVGPNGRISILEMLKTFPFKEEIVVFTYKTYKDGRRVWYKRSSKAPEASEKITANPSFGRGDKVVFWGTRVSIETGTAIVYNSYSNLANASNKGRARSLFHEAGIPIPMLVHFSELKEANYPLIIRRNNHRAGIGFYAVNDEKEALDIINNRMHRTDFYISEVYPKTAEYRVHCASGKALLVKQKPTPKDKSKIAWNFHQNEMPWSTIARKDYDLDMVKMALEAVNVLGLDFGAVDVMSKPESKGFPEHVIVEVNTAPSYTPYLIEKYGAYFSLLFKNKDKMEPWDYSKFKKGGSLSWKNDQLGIKK